MDEKTIKYYDATAEKTAQRYEEADLKVIHTLLLHHLAGKRRVLEIGCGSGRDAAFLLANGFDVIAMEPSAGMLKLASKYHKELETRLVQASFPLPNDSLILQKKFDAIISIATIMHVPEEEFLRWATQARDILVDGGVLMLSGSFGRRGILDNRDSQGRLFIERPADQVVAIFERLGLSKVTMVENEDVMQREVRWYTLVMKK